ncbi:MAG: APC family permease [Planctomycetota bacterium]
MAGLARTLGFPSLTLYGVGIIVGAGVYSVLGEAAGLAGESVWLAFLVASVVALLTALSYAELGTMYPEAGAEYVYLRKAVPRQSWLAFTVGIVLTVAAAATAATVALAFEGYLGTFVDVPPSTAALGLIAATTALNIIGLRLSTGVNVTFTLIEVAGLVAFVVVGMGHPKFGEALTAAPSAGVPAAAALLFFAYLGFEDIVNLAEEARDPSRTLPRAIFTAVGVTSVLYVAVGLAAVALAAPADLAGSASPLVDAAREEAPRIASALGGVALFATANTALIALVAGSRLLFGVARDGGLPRYLARVLPGRQTPWTAAALLGVMAAALVPLGDVGAVASLSSFAALVAFACVNVAVIVLRYRAPERERPFRTPLSVGRFPVLAGAGALTAVATLTRFTQATWIGGGVALAGAGLLWLILGRSKRR